MDTAPAKFKAVTRRNVGDDAVEQVKTLIATGALAPGERLPPERVLSDMLRVSRPTVREAINALSVMGIVEKRQGSGTYVTELTGELLAQPLVFLLDANAQALHDLAEVRMSLETTAAAAAAQRITSDQLTALEGVVGQLREVADADVRAFVAADVRFHRIVHEASANVILMALMSGLSTLSVKSRMVTAQDPDVRAAALRDHGRILDHLRAGDAAGAADSMREHLRHVTARL